MGNMKYIKFSIPAVLITLNMPTFNFKKTQYNKLCNILFMGTNWQSQLQTERAHNCSQDVITIHCN